MTGPVAATPPTTRTARARHYCHPCLLKVFAEDTVDAGEVLAEGMARQPSMTSWAPVDLGPVLDGTDPDPPPSILSRPDGRALLYSGRVHALFGEPEACKGWLALAASAEVLEAGERVLYVDFEDTASSVATRLKALGVPLDAIRERFVYVRPDEPLGRAGGADLDAAAASVALVVLDGITEALTLHGLDLASNTDVAAWLELLPRPLARTGAAVLTIDHVVKDRENRGRYAIGAQHKLAGVDCAYSAQVIEPFGRGRDGRVKVTVTKDRPGHVRAFAEEGRAAEVRLVSLQDGAVTVTLDAPEAGGHTATFRPTTLMERVSRAIEAEPGLNRRALRTGVNGKHDAKDLALELLIAEGYIEPRRDGRAVKHYSVRPYRADEDDRAPVPQPCPQRDPGTVPSDRAPVPPPLGHGARNGDANATGEDLDRAQRLLADHADLAKAA